MGDILLVKEIFFKRMKSMSNKISCNITLKFDLSCCSSNILDYIRLLNFFIQE